MISLPHRSRLRRLAPMLTCAWVVAPIAERFHDAGARHVECEHGARVHVEAILGAAATDAHASLRGDSSAEDHGHDHCLVATVSRERALAPSPAATAIAAPVLLAAPTPRSAPVAAAIPLLRLAPKSSPPA